MKIAVVKPDWRIRGGFEIVMDRLIARLSSQGHDVHVLGFDAVAQRARPFGLRLPDVYRQQEAAFFQYVAHVETVRELSIRRADIVISTQPPSFHVDHPRHLSIFYHHFRPFYDLSPYLRRAHMVDEATHVAAATAIRQIDQPAIEGISWVLAGSEAIADRLKNFNQRTTDLSVFHAGPNMDADIPDASGSNKGFVLCVSRHDFPKRTELFVHAARLAPEVPAVSVGVGGRLGRLLQLNQTYTTGSVPVNASAEDLWLHDLPWVDPAGLASESGNLRFAGAVTDAELFDYYQGALCVVAPALLEDYGLTVIEAMRHGKPVIACTDGGHLQHFVQDGVNGLLVEPTGAAIAGAVRRLHQDTALRERLGRQALETSAQFTWTRAYAEFDTALTQVAS